jgi:cyclohexanecarboxylate-CoA ligase
MSVHTEPPATGIAFRDQGEPVSYADLHRRALSLAAGLRGLGLRKGDVMAVQLPNGLEFILCYLAASYVGVVLQPIHMPYRGAEIEPLLRHGRARVVVCLAQAKDYSPAQLVASLRNTLPDLRSVVAVGPLRPEGTVALETLCEASSAAFDADVDPIDDFLLLYTSGTTASPKGVQVNYARFLANAEACAAELGLTRESVLLSAAPFSHLYGLLSVNLALVTGAANANLPSFSPEGLSTALDRHRPTALFVAPAHIATCLNLGLLTPERLASVAFVMISGNACPPELAAQLQALMPNGRVCQLWGMSELQVGAFTRPTDPPAVRLHSVGRASPGTVLRIADDASVISDGSEGELQIRGASVFAGYLDNPTANLDAFTPDRWFKTGDLAQMDAEGNVRITGRLKELINRGGVKFNPADVEALIDCHPMVVCSAIVPMPDPVLGERACCFLVPRAGSEPTLETLQAWLAAHNVAKNRWPERLDLIDEMPLTPTRKIKKAELAQLAARTR